MPVLNELPAIPMKKANINNVVTFFVCVNSAVGMADSKRRTIMIFRPPNLSAHIPVNSLQIDPFKMGNAVNQ